MKRSNFFFIFIATLTFCACAHDPSARRPASETKLWNAADPTLRQGDLTVWKLQEMADHQDYAALNELYNHGLSMDRLPVGYAAGAGARVLNLPSKTITDALVSLTGKNWRGKIFFPSADPNSSHGLNRIKKRLDLLDTKLIQNNSSIVAMAAFKTEMIDRHELVPDVTSNLVVLNYAHPVTQRYLQEEILTEVQVFDVMVAVPGKYGPLYIGKTWLGSYDENDVFHAYPHLFERNVPAENGSKQKTENLIAWFFLDFNEGALQEQAKLHWDGLEEERLNLH